MHEKINNYISKITGDTVQEITENKNYNEYDNRNNWNYIATCNDSSYKVYTENNEVDSINWI